MAYTDDWAKIQAQIKRYSTPSKNYGDESFRRGMLSGWNQLGQQYQAAGHNRGENMDSLRRDVMNTGYSTNNTRGTYSGDAFGAGMSDINYNYRMQLQDIRNGMTDLADQQWAYTHRPRGGRKPNPLPNDPTPPTAPHASVDPSTGQVIYPDEVYNGYDPNLVRRESERAATETRAQTVARRRREPYYDATLGRMVYPV